MLAACLRDLHEKNYADCPVLDRMTEYVATVERNFATGAYDLSFFTADYGEATASEVMQIVRDAAPYFQNNVLLHGDYCLPNILLDQWRLSAFIDVGNGGVGDRHVDLFWGAWTLRFNLKTDAYRDRFFDAYGREMIENELLRAVAAAEAFG